MKVELITYTPEPEKIITASAKLCYSAVGVDEILEKQTPESIDKFLNMLFSINHHSPLEHVSFTFAIEGVSRSLTHQLVRHRISSFSQQSQRYVNLEKSFDYITPNSIKEHNQVEKAYNKAMENAFTSYVDISNMLIEEYVWEYAVNKGLIPLEAFENRNLEYYVVETLLDKKEYNKLEKKAIEDARYVLPNACETKIVFTMNLRSLINFCKHRCCSRSQSEINELSWLVVKKVEEISPILGKFLGAPCQFGKCPEGAMSCGQVFPKK